jgi:hypothetical protein
LRIFVISTTPLCTAAALKTAGRMAGGLSATITLIAPREVPFPLPLAEPPVPVEFTEAQLSELVRRTGESAIVDVLLCRDRQEAVRQALPAGSLVILGARPRRFGRGVSKLVTALERDGHTVIFVQGKTP